MICAVLKMLSWSLLALALPGASQTEAAPLPDIPTLMHQVEEHQRAAEAIQKDYIYHSVSTSRDIDKHGAVKKTETREYDIFWINGVEVRKLLKKDGRDLTSEEARKESERIDKESAKASEKREKEAARGKPTDSRGNDEVTVSRFLELGRFTSPRRIQMGGRDTIVVEYAGDPGAKTKNSFENVIRDMAGTLWIDEKDRVIVQLQGHFVDAFKIGGGLMVSIQKDTSFGMQQTRINDEVWLPAHIEGRGEARVFLFFKFNGSLNIVNSDYRKFKTTSKILPATAAPDLPK